MAHRNYLVFGSDDKINWEMLKPVSAGGAPQALNKARAQENHRYYAAVPERNWASAEPEVFERDPVVKWKEISSGQLTVDDALEDEQNHWKAAKGASSQIERE